MAAAHTACNAEEAIASYEQVCSVRIVTIHSGYGSSWKVVTLALVQQHWCWGFAVTYLCS
jgi:hypothetical protein